MSDHKINPKKGVSTTVIILVLIVIVAIVGVGAYMYLSTSTAPAVTPTLPNMTLTVVALNGTEKILTSTDIATLPQYTSLGGLVTSAGSISRVLNYTGVPLSTLCEMLGGFNSSISLLVTAADGYSLAYSYEELVGNVTTYDPVTGDEVPHNEPLTPILAYFVNGTTPLPSSDGPLRLVYVGPEGLTTDGHNWIKNVVKIELRPAVEEYTLILNGTGVNGLLELMDRATFESGVNCHGESWVDDKGTNWTGIPLWYLVGRVDDSNKHEDRAFNRTLADTGYNVMIIAEDGFAISLNSSFVKLNYNILLANLQNGTELDTKYWPLRLVGQDLTKDQMIRSVAEIQLIFNGS
ncbi:MAG: hypothetical protein H5T33_03375 [Candidatus Methanosuratus sp.]|nr:hypothetical protein [Candidatus Methanosuratincola sp.]